MSQQQIKLLAQAHYGHLLKLLKELLQFRFLSTQQKKDIDISAFAARQRAEASAANNKKLASDAAAAEEERIRCDKVRQKAESMLDATEVSAIAGAARGPNASMSSPSRRGAPHAAERAAKRALDNAPSDTYINQGGWINFDKLADKTDKHRDIMSREVFIKTGKRIMELKAEAMRDNDMERYVALTNGPWRNLGLYQPIDAILQRVIGAHMTSYARRRNTDTGEVITFGAEADGGDERG